MRSSSDVTRVSKSLRVTPRGASSRLHVHALLGALHHSLDPLGLRVHADVRRARLPLPLSGGRSGIGFGRAPSRERESDYLCHGVRSGGSPCASVHALLAMRGGVWRKEGQDGLRRCGLAKCYLRCQRHGDLMGECEGTMVLQACMLLRALAFGRDGSSHRIGSDVAGHECQLRCLSGSVCHRQASG